MKSATCPACGARFLYPDLKKKITSRTGVCPHCRKKYRISRVGTAIFLVCAVLVLIALNFALLSIPDMNIFFLCFITLAGVVIAYFLLPFSIRFRQAEPARTPRRRAAAGKPRPPAK